MTTTTFHLTSLLIYCYDCVEMAIAAEEECEFKYAQSYADTANETAWRMRHLDDKRGAVGIPSIYA